MLKKYYDKFIALLLLAGLLLSLIWIGILAGNRVGYKDADNKKINALQPEYPYATLIDDMVYSQAIERVRSPFMLPVWTNAALFVPETRVFCVHVNCRKPIPPNLETCPVCGFGQIQKGMDPVADDDGDGIPNAEEIRIGLNPLNADDAVEDSDGDGFSNYDEWKAGTDINDAGSHPPKVVLLRVKEIESVPFPLIFKSHNGQGDRMEFWFTDIRTGLSPRGSMNQPLTHAKDIIVIRYIPDADKRPIPGMKGVFENLPAVVVRRGEKTVTLIKDKRASADDVKVTLVLPGEDREFSGLTENSEFDFDNRRYKLITIDTAAETVVLSCLTEGPGKKDTIVQKLQERNSGPGR